MSVEAVISTQVIDTTSVGRSIMTAANAAAVRTAADAQVTLVSGTNIKTVNSTSLLGSGDIAVGVSGTGATDNRVLRADGTGGATLQNSAVTIDDSGNVTGVAALTAAGFSTVAQTGASGTTIAASGLVTTTFNTGLVSFGQQWVGTNGTTFWQVGGTLQSGDATVQLDAPNRRINLGGGYIHFIGGAAYSGLKSYLNLELSPGALGGGGTYVEINSGTAGTYRDLKCGDITASTTISAGTYTVATLPSASANTYKFANVSDSLAPVLGANVASGGSAKAMVWSDGTNWKVCAA